MASNAENVSIWWCHPVLSFDVIWHSGSWSILFLVMVWRAPYHAVARSSPWISNYIHHNAWLEITYPSTAPLGGTHSMKVTTYAPPFRPPLFQVSGKFAQFRPLYFSKNEVAFRVDGRWGASLSETWPSTPLAGTMRSPCGLICAPSIFFLSFWTRARGMPVWGPYRSSTELIQTRFGGLI